VGADHHIFDVSPAADQDAELTIGLPGNLGELARQIVGDDPLRRNPAAVDLLNTPDLLGAESVQIAEDFLDRTLDVYLNFSGLILRSMRSRNVDQALVRNGVTSFRRPEALHFGQGSFAKSSFIFKRASKAWPHFGHSKSYRGIIILERLR